MDQIFKYNVENELRRLRLQINCLISQQGITVVDNLTSLSSTDALSAHQGFLLKSLIDGLGMGITLVRVNSYSNLPLAVLVPDAYYHVLNNQGTSWLPGFLGGTFYPKGFYYSNGTSWAYVGEVPYQATQSDVNIGTIPDQFVTPLTLKNASQWNTKQDTLVSGTNIKTVNGNSLLGSGNITIAGSSGGSGERVAGEIPLGLINGSNVTFTTAFNFIPGSLEVILNGLTLKIIDEFNTSGVNTLTLTVSPLFGETLLINYNK